MGGGESATNINILRHRHVTHVVRVLKESQPPFPNVCVYDQLLSLLLLFLLSLLLLLLCCCCCCHCCCVAVVFVVANFVFSPVLTVTKEFKYFEIRVVDSPYENLYEYFSDTFDFIHSARQQGGAVLVHWYVYRPALLGGVVVVAAAASVVVVVDSCNYGVVVVFCELNVFWFLVLLAFPVVVPS